MADLGTCRILVVDDERPIRIIIERTLTNAGYQVDTACNGVDALEKFSKTDYEIVISDISMPEMDGQELIRKILEISTSDIIVVTGKINQYTYEQFIPKGVSDFVKKPFSPDEILLRVERVLRERRMAESISQARDRAAYCQKMESIGQIASGVIHEIKTPVQYISDNLDFISDAVSVLIREPGDEPNEPDEMSEDEAFMKEELPKAIAQTNEGLNQIHQIIKAVKSFSHPGVSDHIKYDINECIRDAVTMSKNEWKCVARIKKELAENISPIICNPVEMTQVFLNLIVNACHAIAEKKQGNHLETGQITIVTAEDKGDISIGVSDNGNGITTSDLDKIFHPFFTTKPINLGTGQGLSISKSIVEDRHGGHIEVRSHPGRGTWFTIKLPMDPGQ